MCENKYILFSNIINYHYHSMQNLVNFQQQWSQKFTQIITKSILHISITFTHNVYLVGYKIQQIKYRCRIITTYVMPIQ